jgi:hypothetical protein
MQGRAGAQQAGQGLRAACAWQQTQVQFGQAQLEITRLHNAQIAGQGELKTTPHGHTVERGNKDQIAALHHVHAAVNAALRHWAV